MRKKYLIPLFLLSLCLIGCNKANDIKTTTSKEETVDVSTSAEKLELVGFNKDIKTDEVINPGMGFYRTKYITLIRETTEIEHDFTIYGGFFHVRIDLSDFSKANNGIDDYDIPDTTLSALDNYFTNAKINNASLVIRFAYDGFEGIPDKEPSISKMKDHIKSLAKVINNYKGIIIAVECGLVGPWGEMHTSTIDTQETYNELLKAWLDNVEDLPILARKPVHIYKYLGYTLDNLDEFKNENNIRLGMYDDGYYGDNLDTGTYINLEAREKETKFINKLNNLTGGECIGEPTKWFSYEEIIKEMKLINLTYLNYEWNDSIVASWKNKTYENQSFYNYMANHMGFRLYVDRFDYSLNNNMVKVDIDLANMGFSHITRNLKAKLSFDNVSSVTMSISDTNLSLNFAENIGNAKSVKVYLEIVDDLGRKYELMNGSYENGTNYLGEIKIN